MKDLDPVAEAPRGQPAALSFSLLGFPVRVRLEFAIIAALLGGLGGDGSGAEIGAWVAVVFVSVLFHELGHATVARAVGYRPWIELHGMGGLTHCDRAEATPPPTWRTDLAIALAGPCFGLALGAAVWVARAHVPFLEDAPLARAVVRDMLWANIGWSVLNLVPILPYDGGLAAMAVLGRIFPGRGARMAYQLTVVVAGLALAGSIYARWIWTGYLAARALLGSLRVLRFDGAIREAWSLWDARKFAEARDEARRAAARAPDGFGRARSLELAVFASLALRDSAGAKAAYDAFPGEVAASPLLLALVALDTGERDKAAVLLRAAPAAALGRVVVPLLLSWASSGWSDRAHAWLDETIVAALPREVVSGLGALVPGPAAS